MAVYRDQKLANETVVLDGHEFVNCEFDGCRMVYRGGEMPKLQHCHFARCTWHLEEAAQRSVLFLRSVYHSGPGGRELVEETLRHIRMRSTQG
ncbi:MAG TPA: hypothetical protein VGY58_09725 [Gemmataceae bacterium]|nr:hypothetical protein [Gemmataceae bacterium]